MIQSQDHTEKLEALFEAFHTGGSRAAAGLVEQIFHPEVEFNTLGAGDAGGRTYRGLDGVADFFAELMDALDDVRFESPEFYPVGEDTVVVFTRRVGVDRRSGVPTREELALVYEFADETARRVTAYESPAEALEAAERGHAGA
jgi:ketosteroid isomerase-like protein